MILRAAEMVSFAGVVLLLIVVLSERVPCRSVVALLSSRLRNMLGLALTTRMEYVNKQSRVSTRHQFA
jgi:hypothetical protein